MNDAAKPAIDIDWNPVREPRARDALLSIFIFGFFLYFLLFGKLQAINPWPILVSIQASLINPATFMYMLAPPFVVFALEIWLLGWKASSLYALTVARTVSAKIDLLCMFLFSYLRLGWVFFHVVTFGLFTQMGPIVGAWTGAPKLLQYFDSAVVQFAIAFVVRDFFVYATHWLQHHTQIFWHPHSMHHSASEFNAITVHRLNPLEEQIASVISGIWLALIGTPVETYVALLLLANFQQVLIHSKFSWSFGWFGRWIYVSPAYHQIHHSIAQEHHNMNISTQLVIWDRLFGTYYKGSIPPRIALGLEGKEHNQTFLYEVYVTTWRFFIAFIVGLVDAVRIGASIVTRAKLSLSRG